MAGKNKIGARDRESSEWFGEDMERCPAIYSRRRTKIRALGKEYPSTYGFGVLLLDL